MAQQPVFCASTSPQTLRADVARIVAQSLGGKLDPGQQTLIKINGNYDRYYPGSNSSPWFLDALVRALRDRGFGRLLVVEGDLPQFRATDMVVRTRLKPVLDRYGVPFVGYEGHPRDEHEIPRIFRDSQLINNPVPHAHGIARISCACKNLFGVLPVTRRRYHACLSEKLLELVAELPVYTVVDATVGLDGESTRRGNPRQMDLILAGHDPLGIDVVVARVLGFEPQSVPLLAEAQRRGLVDYDVELCGDVADPAQLPEHRFPCRLSALRRVTMRLEATRLGHSSAFLWLLHKVARLNHLITFARKRRRLYSGPWMAYARALEAAG